MCSRQLLAAPAGLWLLQCNLSVRLFPGVFPRGIVSCICREVWIGTLFLIVFGSMLFLSVLGGIHLSEMAGSSGRDREMQMPEREAEHVAEHLVRSLPQL